MQEGYINSIVRKEHCAVEVRTPIKTKDDNKIVVKGIIITRQRVAHTKIQILRHEMNQFIEEYCRTTNIDDIIKAIIEKKLQIQLVNKLKRIVPISKLEIKKLELK